jgi:hypothetical protein
MAVTITKLGNDGWVHGVVNNHYDFEAKVFNRGSVFGIDGGRISKLFIKRKRDTWDNCFVSYDRGWDIEPATEEHQMVFLDVYHTLQGLPFIPAWG